MSKHRLVWPVTLALLVAGLIAAFSKPMMVEERLISISAHDQFRQHPELLEQPLPIQALLLDYQTDSLLWLKTLSALHVYPEHTPMLLELFGDEPEFRRALRAQGESLIPAVIHFYRNPVTSIEVLNRISGGDAALSPEQRAWHAVNFANQEGDDFTGQFRVAPDGAIEWIWTERITEGITQFFTSGIRTLETRYRTDQEIRASDLGWAAVDAVIIGSAVKFLKAGRVAANTARSASVTTRTASYSARLARAGQVTSAMVSNAKWPALIAFGYVTVKHPAFLNDLFAGAASVLGVPAWAVQVPGWFIIILPLLIVLRWLFRAARLVVPARQS
ncbi:hypothetical protein [Marinobacter sp. S0848L]|uniref:hypothetical protein n=1 Tax=Marinobacter sp. S0848L TaxID=2926423 RepID=UPI001FF2F886|nr:hypothetical protein [Marinobacter sp. S0848L]MCK0107491.1 hypothetical protein [Marinobacter sp. S0848L]